MKVHLTERSINTAAACLQNKTMMATLIPMYIVLMFACGMSTSCTYREQEKDARYAIILSLRSDMTMDRDPCNNTLYTCHVNLSCTYSPIRTLSNVVDINIDLIHISNPTYDQHYLSTHFMKSLIMDIVCSIRSLYTSNTVDEFSSVYAHIVRSQNKSDKHEPKTYYMINDWNGYFHTCIYDHSEPRQLSLDIEEVITFNTCQANITYHKSCTGIKSMNCILIRLIYSICLRRNGNRCSDRDGYNRDADSTALSTHRTIEGTASRQITPPEGRLHYRDVAHHLLLHVLLCRHLSDDLEINFNTCGAPGLRAFGNAVELCARLCMYTEEVLASVSKYVVYIVTPMDMIAYNELCIPRMNYAKVTLKTRITCANVTISNETAACIYLRYIYTKNSFSFSIMLNAILMNCISGKTWEILFIDMMFDDAHQSLRRIQIMKQSYTYGDEMVDPVNYSRTIHFTITDMAYIYSICAGPTCKQTGSTRILHPPYSNARLLKVTSWFANGYKYNSSHASVSHVSAARLPQLYEMHFSAMEVWHEIYARFFVQYDFLNDILLIPIDVLYEHKYILLVSSVVLLVQQSVYDG